ncbi:integrator complex subunit 8-like [Corticium candelabrum]|uniref:integrator complex subunit 8-like n=1 Tax=Corticium candelabrum TaxID=121492 RepID=UPI002E254091|nr:integrator complex subunit 8-like [Corticium candelabrum]
MAEAAFMPFLGPPMPKLPKLDRTTLSCLDFAINESLLDNHLAEWKSDGVDPSPAELINGFLEMSWRVYTESPKLTIRNEEREIKRPPPLFWIKLALRVASSCEWDLQMIEKKLPFQAQRSLFIGLLTDGVQALEIPVADLKLEKIDSVVAMAYILYYSWVMHVSLHCSLCQSIQKKEAPMSSPSKEEVLEQLTPHALRILSQATEIQKSLPLPTFTASGLVESSCVVPCDAIHCQVAFDLGQFHFLHQEVDKARSLFTACQKLLPSVATHSFVEVDHSKLAGYLCACGLSSDVKSPLQSDLMFRAEQSRHQSYKGIVDVLMDDIVKRQLSVDYRQFVEEELAKVADLQSVYRLVCLCNAVRAVIDCQLIPSTFWSLFEDSISMQITKDLSFVCQACSLLVREMETNVTIKKSVGLLLRELCLRLRKHDVLSVVQQSNVSKCFSEEDWKIIEGVCREKSPSTDITICPLPRVEIKHFDSGAQIWFLLDQLSQTLQPSHIHNLISDLTHVVNNSEEADILLYKHYGNHPYINVSKQIPDSYVRQLCCVFQSKAQHCFKLEIYDSAVSLLQAAIETINKCKSKQSEVINVLEQQFLVAQLLHTQASDYRQVNPQLLKRARCFVQVAHSAESGAKQDLVEMVVVCLLNSRDWDFLIDQHQYNGELWYQLACCCKFVFASQDLTLRGFSSHLWKLVLAILSRDLGKTEQLEEERRKPTSCHSLLKFSNQIKDSTALSLLISCLVKLSNLIRLSKTMSGNIPLVVALHTDMWSNEVSCELPLDYVNGTVMSMLNRAIQVGGPNPFWLRSRADLLFVERDYRPSLKNYLEAGAAASNFFAKEVPPDIWSNDIYFRLVEICNVLGMHMQAAVICQCTEPVDHDTAFKSLQQAFSQGSLEDYHDCVWDVSILEFMIKMHTKHGQQEKRALAVQALSQAQLNSCNLPEVLCQAANIRKGKFFRMLADRLLSGC